MEKSKPAKTNLNFTVATVVSNFSTDIEKELAHIKTAILYADDISIISMFLYPFTFLYDPKAGGNELKAVKHVKKIAPHFAQIDKSSSEEMATMADEVLTALKSPAYKLYPNKKKFRKELFENIKQLNDRLRARLQPDHLADIETLIKLKEVNIYQFRSSNLFGNIGEEMFSRMAEALETSYPLFDDYCNALIISAEKEGIIRRNASSVKKHTHAGLSHNLLAQLPTFPNNPVDEVVDIRRELDKYLTRFRAKISHYADDLKSIPGDKDFDNECEDLYNKYVLPSIKEIEEHIKDSSFRANLGKKTLYSDGQQVMGFCIALGGTWAVSTVTEAITNTQALIASGALWSLQQAAQSKYEEYRGKIEASRKDLYFYHEAAKKFSR